MGLATVVGISGGFALVLSAMLLGGSIGSFVDAPAVLIVLGGTFMVTLASFSLAELLRAGGVMLRAILTSTQTPSVAAYRMMELAEQARRDGVLGLQIGDDQQGEEPFLRKALTLVADGTPGDEVERILRREVVSRAQRTRTSADVFRRAAEVAPAMGLIGTLVGLVQMLSNLDDPSSIGPAMAIALLTTFYGAVLAYMVFSPLASKLERRNDEDTLVQTLYMTGAASIGRHENPRRLEMLLNAILPPAQQIQYFD